MKFEKLTDTKIRIILSLTDMELNNISIENILSNSDDSQKLLETMICKAEIELGFKADDSQLLVEAVSPSNDECIFTITKIIDENTCTTNYKNSFIFKFEYFDDFINLCCFLNNFAYLDLKTFSKNFSLIYHNDTYYLKLIEPINSSIIIDYLKTLFDEFGTNVSCHPGIDGILNEYGKIIWKKNAIIKCIHSFV